MNAWILPFSCRPNSEVKNSCKTCAVCGTFHRPGETWNTYCDQCTMWIAVGERIAQVAQLLKAAR